MGKRRTLRLVIGAVLVLLPLLLGWLVLFGDNAPPASPPSLAEPAAEAGVETPGETPARERRRTEPGAPAEPNAEPPGELNAAVVPERTVVGLVRGQSGDPAAGAIVWSGSPRHRSPMTGADGRYSLQVPVGRRTICARGAETGTLTW